MNWAPVIYVNLPFALVCCYVLVAMFMRKSRYIKRVAIGLFISLGSSVIGVPYTDWLLDTKWEWFTESHTNMAISTIPIGIVGAIGLFISLSPLIKDGNA